MKPQHFFSLLFFFSISAAGMEFNEIEYYKVWTGSQGTSEMVEYIPEGEALKNWTKMLTFQKHPDKKQVKDVLGPYVNARMELIGIKPQIFRKEGSESNEDLTVQLFLGAPGKTPHIEFVLARFFSDTNYGCYVVVYSHKLPAQETLNVNEVMDQRDSLIQSLGVFDPNQISDKFN